MPPRTPPTSVNRRWVWAYLPALGWSWGIWMLSTNNPAELPQFALLSWDKAAHAVAYGLLMSLWLAGAWLHRGLAPKPLAQGLGFGLAFGYGVTLEFVQAALPYRSFDYADMLANGIGALGCWGVFGAWRWYQSRTA